MRGVMDARSSMLDRPMLVSGFFREVLLYAMPIEAHAMGSKARFRILEIEEASGRADGTRRIVLHRIDGSAPENVGHTLTWTATSPRGIASWEAPFEGGDEEHPTLRLPDQLHVVERRRSARRRVERVHPIAGAVLVECDGVTLEARIEIEDLSASGVGARLYVPKEAPPIREATTVRGRVECPSGGLELDELVVWAEPDATEVACERTYRVGLVRRESLAPSTELLPVSIEVKLLSPLAPTQPIVLHVDAATPNALRGRLANPADAVLLRVGILVRVEGSMIVARLDDLAADALFTFEDSTAEARLHWLNLIDRAIHPEAAEGHARAELVLQLFCESGAISSRQIARQRSAMLAFGADVGTTADDAFVYRWIEQTADGRVRGHMSVARMAENVWYWGGLAGSPERERKLTGQFFPRFAAALRDWARNAVPCPRITGFWVAGHPFWRELETYLDGPGRSLRIGTTLAWEYANAMVEKTTRRAVMIDPIAAHEYDRIDRLRAALAPDVVPFADAVDFHRETFGSPGLARAVREAGRVFRRCYAEVSSGDGRWLAVFSELPRSANIHRNHDLTWLFPLDGSSVDDESHDAVRRALREYALRRGFSPPRLVEMSTIKRPGADRGLSWFVWHPDVFDWFC